MAELLSLPDLPTGSVAAARMLAAVPGTGGGGPTAYKVSVAALAAATVPATSGLLAGSGAAGAAQAATNTQITAAIIAWFASLPTTLPSTTGQPWNDGNTLAFS